jgi:hypothetical protein
MNDDQLEDLKQFIAASVSQSEERLRGEMNQGFQAVRQEMADGFLGVGEAIDTIHKQMGEQNAAVDKRLTKLERQIA